jgi:hypothetical protein
MGLRPTKGHECPPATVIPSAARNLLLMFFPRSRFLVATLLGMTGRLGDFRQSVCNAAMGRPRRLRRSAQKNRVLNATCL